jgi:hypothetical protein
VQTVVEQIAPVPGKLIDNQDQCCGNNADDNGHH